MMVSFWLISPMMQLKLNHSNNSRVVSTPSFMFHYLMMFLLTLKKIRSHVQTVVESTTLKQLLTKNTELISHHLTHAKMAHVSIAVLTILLMEVIQLPLKKNLKLIKQIRKISSVSMIIMVSWLILNWRKVSMITKNLKRRFNITSNTEQMMSKQ